MSPKKSWGARGVTQQTNPDADLTRSFAVGCGVMVIVFLCGWATIAFFWLR